MCFGYFKTIIIDSSSKIVTHGNNLKFEFCILLQILKCACKIWMFIFKKEK